MSWRIFWGVILLALGVGFLLDLFQVLPQGSVAEIVRWWWPLLFVLIGVNALLRRPFRPWWPLILIVVGLLLLARGVLNLTSADIWGILGALLLVLLGLRLLLPRRVRQAVAYTLTTPLGPTSTDAVINDSLSFAEKRVRLESGQFRGGKISVVFGTYEIDLRGATLAAEGAILELSTTFGQIHIRVPENSGLQVTGAPVFGNIENTTRPTSAQLSPALQIRCAVMFGNIEISD